MQSLTSLWCIFPFPCLLIDPSALPLLQWIVVFCVGIARDGKTQVMPENISIPFAVFSSLVCSDEGTA